MAYQYPDALNRLVKELSALPGVGQKAAQRLAFFLLGKERPAVVALARSIVEAHDSVHPCPQCGNFTDQPLCPICQDNARDRSLLCVVEGVADLISMERSGAYRGLYHVLGGVISPMDGVGPEQLDISALEKRLSDPAIREVVMATNPTAEGEVTAQYLAKRLRRPGLRITRLAHGMPVGGSLAFVDEATLDLAMSGRRDL